MIVVTQFYQRVGGVVIRPGTYAPDDPALCGLGDFLMQSGRAHFMPAPAAPVVEASAPIEADEPVTEEAPAPRKRSKGGG